MAETIIAPGVYTRENDVSFIQPAAVDIGAAIIGPTVKGPVEFPTTVTSYNEYSKIFGVTFESGSTNYEFLTSLAVKNYFQQGGQSVLVTRVVSGSFTSATNTDVSSTLGATGSFRPFILETIGKGELFNNSTGATDGGAQNSDSSLVSGSTDNLRWEVSNLNNSQGTFSLSIRRGDDSLKSKIILETWNDVSLDPNSPNYIEKLIGNQTTTLVTGNDGTYIRTSGSYANKSSYVRVAGVNLKTINYIANDGSSVNVDSNNVSYSASLPLASSGSFYGATGSPYGATAGNYFTAINNTNTQGLVAGNYTNAIELLSNTEDYQFNVITAPGIIYNNATHITVVDSLIALAESRKDCIFVVDLVNYGAAISTVVSEAASLNSNYTATYWPWVQMRSAVGRDEFVPASVVIPGIFAFTDAVAQPWYAPAGLIRGGVPGIVQAERRINTTQRGTLYTGKINTIATFPGQGIAVMGQKTLQTKASALDRINVRRLLIEIKDFISKEARKLVFEQNTVRTRKRFKSIVDPYLDSVVQREGLYTYRVVMDETNNTSDVIDRNQMIGKIVIQPTRTAEYILLDFTIEPTGATFS